MSLIDKFYLVGDFRERVVVTQCRDGATESFEILDAASFSRRLVNVSGNDNLPPRINAVWRLPLLPRTRSIRRGDRFRDAASQTWIVASSEPNEALQLLSCQCFCEQLFPNETDVADILRPLRVGGLKTLVSQAPALVRSRKISGATSDVFPGATATEETVFWIKIATPVRPRDVVSHNGTRYDVVGYQAPSKLSDWGVLSARKVSGVDESWARPTQK